MTENELKIARIDNYHKRTQKFWGILFLINMLIGGLVLKDGKGILLGAVLTLLFMLLFAFLVGLHPNEPTEKRKDLNPPGKKYYSSKEKINVPAWQKDRPFVAFIKDMEKHTFEVLLVNPTSTAYNRIKALTAAYSGEDEELIQTNMVIKEIGLLSPNSFLQLEKGNFWDLDFVIWYHLDMYTNDNQNPYKVGFSLPKGSWEYKLSHLPIVEVEGMPIDLKVRNE